MSAGEPLSSPGAGLSPEKSVLRDERAPAEQLRQFRLDVVMLVAELSYTGPCLPHEVELQARAQALGEFFGKWVTHPRVGYPTKERLEALEYAVRERGWLARFATIEAAVNYLRQCVRGRSKPINALPLMPELVAAVAVDQVEELDLLDQVVALPAPERSYLEERLAGETWEVAASIGSIPPSTSLLSLAKSLRPKARIWALTCCSSLIFRGSPISGRSASRPHSPRVQTAISGKMAELFLQRVPARVGRLPVHAEVGEVGLLIADPKGQHLRSRYIGGGG